MALVRTWLGRWLVVSAVLLGLSLWNAARADPWMVQVWSNDTSGVAMEPFGVAFVVWVFVGIVWRRVSRRRGAGSH